MEINKECNLFLNEVYSYDIKACHYTILKKLGYGMENIPENDKLKRNIHIGLMMRDNPRLTKLLRNTTESTISDYISRNNLSNNDIIIRQYDGILTKKILEDTKQNIPLDLRCCYYAFLISFNRKQFLAYDGNNFSIKGVPDRYEYMDRLFKKIITINFANKSSIFKNLKRIKDEIYQTDDANLFCIPDKDKVGKYNVFLKEYGQTQISKNMINIMDISDIDRNRYFDYYIRPFTQSIVYEFL